MIIDNHSDLHNYWMITRCPTKRFKAVDVRWRHRSIVFSISRSWVRCIQWNKFKFGENQIYFVVNIFIIYLWFALRRIWPLQNERVLFPRLYTSRITSSSLSSTNLLYIFQFYEQNILWEICWNRQSVPGLACSKLRAKHNPWTSKGWKLFYKLCVKL